MKSIDGHITDGIVGSPSSEGATQRARSQFTKQSMTPSLVENEATTTKPFALLNPDGVISSRYLQISRNSSMDIPLNGRGP